MRELMQQLEADGTPAPAPIEQRWSAASSADMSPVASRGEPDGLHSWVGIIMYLPAEDRHTRKAITDRSACRLPALAPPLCTFACYDESLHQHEWRRDALHSMEDHPDACLSTKDEHALKADISNGAYLNIAEMLQ